MSECIWKEYKEARTEDDGIYDTGCYNMFTIMEGNPKENNFKFCPYCGKPIREQETK